MIFHPSLAGRATQNYGWVEVRDCRVSDHEDDHLAGYPHMHNHPQSTLVIDSARYDAVNGAGQFEGQFRTYSLGSYRNYPYEQSSLAHYNFDEHVTIDPCLLYTSPSPRDATLSRMPSSA